MTTHDDMGPRGNPPRLAEWFLKRVVPPGPAGRSMLGDAREEYAGLVGAGSHTRAYFRYWGLALSVAAHFLGRPPRVGSAAFHVAGASPSPRPTFTDVLFDVRLAVRSLLRRPTFTLASVATLALGIGATTTVFSIAHGVLFQPLPYPEADRLVGVFREDPDVTGMNPTAANVGGLYAIPYALYEDWRSLSPVFDATGAFTPFNVTVTSGERAERIRGAIASSGVFTALGVPALIGRTFAADDDAIGAPQVAVLGHGYWDRAYGRNPDVLGRTIVLSGSSYVVVGVMPEGFNLPGGQTHVWVNFDDDSKQAQGREAGWLQVMARLRPEVSFEQAEGEMDALALRIIEDHPVEAGKGVAMFPLRDLLVSRARAGLWILAAAVGMVLLIACANIAGLLLVRATDRRRELAVRLAMGSGRLRVVSQFMIETGLIALAGGMLGYGAAVLVVGPFVEAFPGGLPRSSELGVDGRVLLITAGLAGLTALLTGTLPALFGASTQVSDVLRGSGRSVAGGARQRRIQGLLVTSEITLAVFLLVVAGLFMRSFDGMSRVDPGFETEGILTSYIVLPSQYRDPPELADAFFRDATDRIAALPRVAAVVGVTQMPYSGGYSAPPVRAEGDDGYVDGIAHISHATPGYFEALGIPLLRGRAFSPDDSPDSEPVAVVNQAMAERYWPDQDPIGKRLKINSASDSTWFAVVGVVAGIRYDLDRPPVPEFYLGLDQLSYSYRTVVVKAEGDAAALAPQIRQAVWDVDPNIPVSVTTLASRLENSPGLGSVRFGSILLGGLACIAALLAILGVYAILAYTVAQRTQEIGIQIALGAATSLVVAHVLKRGLRMGVTGVALGLGLALLTGRFLESLIFEIQPSDPVTLSSVAALVLAATLVAAWLPARRAVRVDPVEALRME